MKQFNKTHRCCMKREQQLQWKRPCILHNARCKASSLANKCGALGHGPLSPWVNPPVKIDTHQQVVAGQKNLDKNTLPYHTRLIRNQYTVIWTVLWKAVNPFKTIYNHYTGIYLIICIMIMYGILFFPIKQVSSPVKIVCHQNGERVKGKKGS